MNAACIAAHATAVHTCIRACVWTLVHATVCKHVHTIHELRQTSAIEEEGAFDVLSAAWQMPEVSPPEESSDVESDAEVTKEYR